MATTQGYVRYLRVRPRSMRRSLLLTLLLAAGVAAAPTLADAGKKHGYGHGHGQGHGHHANGPLISTDKGQVRGFTDKGMDVFLGIPFAAPPVGELRWRPPQSAARWHGILEAVDFGDKCVQGDFGNFSTAGGSEDCLYLNVFAPKGASASSQKKGHSSHAKLKPVMVWLYGGGMRTGDTNSYDPVKLVNDGDVVFVSVSYRVNIFGMLAHPAIDNEGHPTSNYAIMDMQAGLRWVQRNIRQFGGDPNNVTIFGESAGGSAVYYNMISPTAKGLFHRAIVESTGFAQLSEDYTAAQARGVAFAAAIGCGGGSDPATADCMRSASTQDIINSTYVGVGPYRVLDGTILSINTAEAIESGQFNKTPVIIGSNRDENTWFYSFTELASGIPLSAADYPAAVASSFGAANAAAVLAQYPLADYPNPSNALASAQTGNGFGCQPRRRGIKKLVAHVPVWAYTFTDRTAPNYFLPVSFNYWAGHTLELQYLFKDFHGAGGTLNKPLSHAQEKLSDDMVSYWTQFARTGNPNSHGTPYWQNYKLATDNYQRLDLPRPSYFLGFAEQQKCDFWDALSGE